MAEKFEKVTKDAPFDKFVELGVFAIGMGAFVLMMDFFFDAAKANDPIARLDNYPWIPHDVAAVIAFAGMLTLFIRTKATAITTTTLLVLLFAADLFAMYLMHGASQGLAIKAAISAIPVILVVKTCTQAVASPTSSYKPANSLD